MLEKAEKKMKACTPNKKRDSKKNLYGESNIVALWRRTRKGQKLVIDGTAWGVEGRNGSDYYEIRVGADGILYCSCKDYQIRGHKSNRANAGTNYLCKHVRAFLNHVRRMIDDGVAQDSECVLYKPEVALAYVGKLGAAAAAGQKVARAA
jgi:hypothetical protein